MAEARSIETLSVTFTAGVIAGTFLPETGPILPCVLLSLLLLPFLFPQRIIRLSSPSTVILMGAVFLLLGLFCAWNGRQPAPDTHSWLRGLAEEAVFRLREHIGSLPFRSPETAPVLLALLTGDRSSLSPEIQHVFRDSGASHLLALSGLHIGIIYLVFDKLTRLLGRSPAVRKLRFVLLVTGAGFFTLMTGAGPSIVRAFLFIVINETLHLLTRPGKPVRVLCLALLIQLVLDPSVIGNTGFQLSYLAMAGIFLLYPVLERWYPPSGKYDPLRKIWSLAALSISCQIFTGPLAWMRFHSFPRFFLLTNLLAIPVTTGLMTASVACVALSAPGLCPSWLYTATDGICRLLLWILEVIASL